MTVLLEQKLCIVVEVMVEVMMTVQGGWSSSDAHRDHTTPILCMITQPQYVWHHLNYIWPHFHSLCYHTTLWHHTFCIHVITPRIPVIASTVAGPLLIVYWLYHTYYMCDIKPPICGFYMNSCTLQFPGELFFFFFFKFWFLDFTTERFQFNCSRLGSGMKIKKVLPRWA